MFFKHTSRAIGELAKEQPGPKEIGTFAFLVQSFVTAVILVGLMGGTMLVVAYVLSWAMEK